MSIQDDAIAALKRGEGAALAVLVDLHQLKARRTAFLILGDRAAAEDVVADAFLLVWQRIGRFDATKPFEPWFYRVVVNRAIDDRRRRARSQPHSLTREAASGSDDLEGSETRADLAGQLHDLPRVERVVVVLRYFHDLDEPTIAALLGCPVGTVKSRLHRARGRLRIGLSTTEPHWAPAPSSKGA